MALRPQLTSRSKKSWIMKKASLVFTALAFAVLATSSLGFQQSKKPFVSSGYEGTITGKISLTGTVPKARHIYMEADPECVKSHPEAMTEDAIVSDGMIANVLVYVKSSELDSYHFEPPSTPATIERKGCQLIPRVVAIQTKQRLQVLNNSATTHNTNVQSKDNPKWSVSQAPGGEAIERSFESPERLIVIKDNQHPWEKTYMSVFAHPFFMVTGRDGTYTITGLPVGEYTLVAWHETLGEQQLKVSVGAGETKNINFTFTNSEQ